MSGSAIALEVECVKTLLKHIRMSSDHDRLSCYIRGTARDFCGRLQSGGRSPPEVNQSPRELRGRSNPS